MSSDRIVIVACNTETGEIRLPLGNVMLYSTEHIDEFVRRVCADFGEEWVVSAYRPTTGLFVGTKPAQAAPGAETVFWTRQRISHVLEDCATYLRTLYAKHRIKTSEQGIDPDRLDAASRAAKAAPCDVCQGAGVNHASQLWPGRIACRYCKGTGVETP